MEPTGDAAVSVKRPRYKTKGIARGALVVASLTAFSRMLGLVRTLVFSQSVGAGCLGTAYVTANQVPNLIYELALGGALTSAMVPILARSAEPIGDRPQAKARVAQITSALLTWAVVILVPVTAIIVGVAGPIAAALIPVNPNASCARADMVGVTSHMLVVFAPQILLYGLSVVLFGLLQAYRRFTGPALAPVIAQRGHDQLLSGLRSPGNKASLARTPLVAELVLSIGTTMNIGTLVSWRAARLAAAAAAGGRRCGSPRGHAAGRRPRAGRRCSSSWPSTSRRGHHRPRQRPRRNGRAGPGQLRADGVHLGLRRCWRWRS